MTARYDYNRQAMIDASPPAARRGAASPLLLPMAAPDVMWVQDSITNPMIINAVFTTDALDLQTLHTLWRERVMEVEGGRRFHRFTHRVVRLGSRYFWEEDPDFDLARHILPAPVPEIATRAELQGYLGEVAARPLSGDRPLWQIQLVPRYRDGSAFIVRIHHCMGDGVTLVPVLFALVDPSPDRPAEPFGAVADTAKGAYAGMAAKALAAAAGPFVLARHLVAKADKNVLRGRPLSGTKRVAWTPPLDLSRVKETKNRLGATVNDILMASLAGAVRRYDQLQANGLLQAVRASIPVNVRAPGEPYRMENRFALALLSLPVGIADPVERVRAVRARMQRLKRSVEPLVMFGAANLMLKTLPQALSRRLIDFFANKCSCVLTNVPGPQEPLYLGGRRLRNLIFWVPQRADIGVGISILSFSGAVRVGVISDRDLLSEPGALTTAFEEEFQTLETAVAP
jgi:WS/DGAT/MGAT family acyltransferase